MPDALDVAQKTYVDVNIHDKENESVLEHLSSLPDSCAASADLLEKQREAYEEAGVFSAGMIDGIIAELRAFDDRTLRHDIKNDAKKVKKLVDRYFHCG